MRLYSTLGVFLLAVACGRTEVFELAPDGPEQDPGSETEGPDGGLGRDGGPCTRTLQITHRLSVSDPEGFGLAFPYEGGFIHLAPGAGRGRLVRTELRTARSTLAAEPGGELTLVDGDARRSLFVLAQDGEAGLWLEDARALRRLALGSASPAGFGTDPRRQLTPDFVAYCGDGGWSIHADELATGRSFASLVQDGVRCAEPLFMEGRDIVHMGRDSQSRTVIIHYRAAEGGALPRIVASGGQLAMPALQGGRLYYLRDGFLVSQTLEPGAPWTTHSRDPCSSLDVGPSGVIAACGVEPGAWPLTPAKYLLLHDGRSTSILEFPESRMGYMMLPRIGDGLVAWLDYDDPNALCGGSFEAPAGRVMLAALPRGPAIEVGPIFAGCFCCGAIWPNPLLQLRDDTLVFNYDAAAGGAMSREGGLGAVLIHQACAP